MSVCSVDTCDRPVVARGWCSKHWSRWKRNGHTATLLRERGAPLPVCSISTCEKPANGARGWCGMHYRRFQRHGSPLVTSRIVGDDEARFHFYVDKHGPDAPGLGACWIWLGALTGDGYGVMASDLPTSSAHRWAYRQWVGDLDSTMEIDHLCRTRACVNPQHLEQVSHEENLRRSRAA